MNDIRAIRLPGEGVQDDLRYQAAILPGVSRTFALTIPALPRPLSEVVTSAYLLCRIADTIEDDTALGNEQKSDFHRRFLAVLEGRGNAREFAGALAPLLSARTLRDERDLVGNSARIVRLAHGYSDIEQQALLRCLTVMCTGMPEFQRNRSLQGLQDIPELEAYCYVVAGVVGEMLTDLFCVHCPELEGERERMQNLAVSFGQGLQMTNILKDIWDDWRNGTCWLPRSVFQDRNFRLERLDELHDTGIFREGLRQLIAVARKHLHNALRYTCRIPVREAGMRRFCLWALGLAVLTLQKLHRKPRFDPEEKVKVSRRTVRATTMAADFMLRSNRSLQFMFRMAASGLPKLHGNRPGRQYGP